MGSEVTRFNGLGGHWSSGVNGIVESLGSLWLLGSRVNCVMGSLWFLVTRVIGLWVMRSLCHCASYPQDPSEPKPKRQQHPQTPVTIGANSFLLSGKACAHLKMFATQIWHFHESTANVGSVRQDILIILIFSERKVVI